MTEQQQVQRLTKRLRLMRQLAQALLPQQEPGAIAQTALDHLHDLIPCVWGSVCLYDRESQMMTVLAVRVPGETHIPQGAQIPIGDMPTLTSPLSQLDKQLICVTDLGTVARPSVFEQRLRVEGIQSYISIPLIVEGELFGSLNFGAQTPGFFRDEYQEVAQEAADLITIALQQTVLRTDLQMQTAALQQATKALQRERTERRQTKKAMERRITDRNFELRALNAALLEEIEARKQFGTALRESEGRFRLLCENAYDLITELKPDGQAVYGTPNHREVLGYEREEVVGRNVFDLIHPDDLPHVLENIQRNTPRSTFRFLHRDATWRWLESSGHNYTTAQGEERKVVISRDITERRRAEEALRASEERYRTLFESSTDVLVTYDFDGSITTANKAVEKLSGYSPAELIGQYYGKYVSATTIEQASERVRQLLRKEVQTASLFEGEVIRKDGRRVPIETWIHPIHNEHQRVVAWLTNYRDITERKQTEAALQTLSRRLLEVQENERRALAHELHEEIGQVLSAIKINLDTLQEELQPVPQKITESISFLAHSLQHIRSLSLDLHPTILDDLGLPAALQWYASRQAQQADFTLHLNDRRPTSVAPHLELACFRIAQEALTNIAKHAQAQNVWIELHSQNQALHILIRDDGRGFDLGEAQKRAQQGLSLGLLSMQERVRLSSGQLTIQSSPQSGTTVQAVFPTQPHKSSTQVSI